MNIPYEPERPPSESGEGSGKSFLVAALVAGFALVFIFIVDVVMSRPEINILVSGNNALAISGATLIGLFVIFEILSSFSAGVSRITPTTRKMGAFGFVIALFHVLSMLTLSKSKLSLDPLGSVELPIYIAKASFLFLTLTFMGCVGFFSKKLGSKKQLYLQIMGLLSIFLISIHAILISNITTGSIFEVVGPTEITFLVAFAASFSLVQVLLYFIGKHLSLKAKVLTHTLLYFVVNSIVLGLYLGLSDIKRHQLETFQTNRNNINLVEGSVKDEGLSEMYQMADEIYKSSEKSTIVFFLNTNMRISHHPEKREEDKAYLGLVAENRTKDGYGWDINYQKEGSKYLDTAIDLGGNRGYIVSSTNQTKHAINFSKQIAYAIIIAFIFIVSTVVMTVIFTKRNILDPIKKIIIASDKMSQGDLDTRVSVDTNDDFATLADIFNTLSKRMQDQINDLLKMDKLKNEFIAIASHNLRTPLTTLRGYLDMLETGKAGKLNKKQKDMLEKAGRSATSLASLTEGLVNIASLETEGVKIEKNEVELKGVIGQILEDIDAQIKAKKINVNNKLGDEPIETIGDASKLKQAFLSIFENAVKFNKDGGEIIIEKVVDDTRKETIGRGEVIIKITDTGIGISKEEKENVFKKFNRGTSTYTYQYEGVGLGLYIAKLIIQAHHGRIWFESTQDKGTTFYISLTTTEQNAIKG